jgi:hypothetical protein
MCCCIRPSVHVHHWLCMPCCTLLLKSLEFCKVCSYIVFFGCEQHLGCIALQDPREQVYDFVTMLCQILTPYWRRDPKCYHYKPLRHTCELSNLLCTCRWVRCLLLATESRQLRVDSYSPTQVLVVWSKSVYHIIDN